MSHTSIVIPVNRDLVGTFLVPMRKTANKSHRIKYLANIQMQIVYCEGWLKEYCILYNITSHLWKVPIKLAMCVHVNIKGLTSI